MALSSLALGAVLLAAVCATAATVNVGSFAKTTAGAPASQSIAHGLSTTPKAVILWTMSKTGTSFSVSYSYGLGMTDGTTSKSSSSSSLDNSDRSDTARRIANKALTVVDWTQTVLAEADLLSWDATNFTLRWTTNNASAYTVHFVAIGGDDVSATVVGWTMKSGTTGTQAVTGFGFKPDLVIHSHVGAGFTTVPPGTQVSGAIGFGAMDAQGNQWAIDLFSSDNSDTSDTQRYQRTDRAIGGIRSDLTVAKEASFVSMDADGFTLNWTIVDAAASKVFSLALKGITAKVGSFTKATATAPASQSITGVPFRPSVVLFASNQNVASSSVQTHSRFGIGASNVASEGSSACQDTDALGFSSVDGIDSTSKAFVKVNNDTPAIDAEADLTSVDSAGFTLNWTTNDAVATEILYLALGNGRRIWLVD